MKDWASYINRKRSEDLNIELMEHRLAPFYWGFYFFALAFIFGLLLTGVLE